MPLFLPPVTLLFAGDPGVEDFARNLNEVDPDLIIYPMTDCLTEALTRLFADLAFVPPSDFLEKTKEFFRENLGEDIFAKLVWATAEADGFGSLYERIVVLGIKGSDINFFVEKAGASKVCCIHLGPLRPIDGKCRHIWIPVSEKRVEYLKNELTPKTVGRFEQVPSGNTGR